MRVDLTYRFLLTRPPDLSNILRPWATYNAVTDANGDAMFSVPLTSSNGCRAPAGHREPPGQV